MKMTKQWPIVACAVGAIVTLDCNTEMTRPSSPRFTQVGLDRGKLAKLKATQQGCFFSIPDPTGGRRVLDLRGKHLPFTLPAISPGATRPMNVTVRNHSIPQAVTVSCWVPASMTFAAFAAQVSQANLAGIYVRLHRGRLISAKDLSQPLSPEMIAYRDEMMQNPMSPLIPGGQSIAAARRPSRVSARPSIAYVGGKPSATAGRPAKVIRPRIMNRGQSPTPTAPSLPARRTWRGGSSPLWTRRW